jgi:hypothetical protein
MPSKRIKVFLGETRSIIPENAINRSIGTKRTNPRPALMKLRGWPSSISAEIAETVKSKLPKTETFVPIKKTRILARLLFI